MHYGAIYDTINLTHKQIKLLGGYRMKDLRMELMVGIGKYGEEHIDLVMDTDNNIVYGGLHSERDSFAITKKYKLQTEEAIKLSNEMDIGYFEL